MRRPQGLLLAGLVVLCPPLAAGPQSDDERTAAAIEAVREGELAKARELLADVLIDEALIRARDLLAAGQPRDALVPLDEALELDEERSDAWFLRGKAALATAPTDSQPAFFYKDAQENLERAVRLGYGPEAHLAASRAAYMNLDFVRALELARTGRARIIAADSPVQLDQPAEKTWAEAAYRVYIAEKQAAGEDGSEAARAAFTETQNALELLLGRTPEDPWVWTRLAELYQWERDSSAARRALESGLSFSPLDESLHQRFTNAVRDEGGRAAVIDAYSERVDASPDSPLEIWYLAVEKTYAALDSLQEADASATFEEAEALFQRCRRLQPGYADACVSYELICRDGVGWCRYYNDDLDGAVAAFRSMEELKQGGLEWELKDYLFSGARGLEFVASRYAPDEGDGEKQTKAAEIYDFLFAYRPTDSAWANNAGFFNRNAAIALEAVAAQSLRAAEEATDSDESRRLTSEGQQQRARAQQKMEASYAAYVAASEMVPDDVRVVNDTGLIMTYYLRTDIEAAERYLYSAVEKGAEQLPVMRERVERERAAFTELEAGGTEPGELELARTEIENLEQEFLDLTEAWGDAHQNLGVLYQTITDEPARAKRWYAKSVEIGPYPRPFITESLIPACDRAAAGEPSGLSRLGTSFVWAHNP